MINKIQTIGANGLEWLASLGRAGLMLFHALLTKPSKSFFKAIWDQIYFIGVQSMLIILVSGLFIGMVLGLQAYTNMLDFGAQGNVGQLVALALLRELGPVVTALLFAGRACSALTAEIGLMKATEQLSSMEMMATDPLKKVIAPRFWAGFISVPLLTAMFNLIGIYGGYLVAVKWLGVDDGSFWSLMLGSVQFYREILNSFIKSVVFGSITTWVALYNGYNAVPNSIGISQATTRSVVNGSLLVLALDFILTAFMFG